MDLLISLLINALIILAAAYLLPGISVSGFGISVCIALLLAILYGWLAPFLLSLLHMPPYPILHPLLGLIILALSAFIISWVLPGFKIKSFGWALGFAATITVISLILHRLVVAAL